LGDLSARCFRAPPFEIRFEDENRFLLSGSSRSFPAQTAGDGLSASPGSPSCSRRRSFFLSHCSKCRSLAMGKPDRIPPFFVFCLRFGEHPLPIRDSFLHFELRRRNETFPPATAAVSLPLLTRSYREDNDHRHLVFSPGHGWRLFSFLPMGLHSRGKRLAPIRHRLIGRNFTVSSSVLSVRICSGEVSGGTVPLPPPADLLLESAQAFQSSC